VLKKLDSDYAVKDDQILDFITQLEAGKGVLVNFALLNQEYNLQYK